MLQLIRDFLHYRRTFELKGRLSIAGLVAGGIVLTLLELLGISALFPLLIIILDPASLNSMPWLATIGVRLGMQDPLHMAMLLGFAICGIYIIKGLFHMAYWRFEFRTLTRWRINTCKKFYDAYMSLPYEKIMQRNSAELINIVSGVIPETINSFVFPAINLLIYLMTAVAIVTYLFTLNWIISAIVLLFGAALLLVQTQTQRKVSQQLGTQISALRGQQLSVLQQSFAGFKETKLHLKEEFFSQRYRALARSLAEAEQKLTFFQQIPTITIELVLIAMVMTIFFVLNALDSNMRLVGAQLGTMVLSLFRIIPLLNRAIVAVMQINSTKGPLQLLFAEYAANQACFSQPSHAAGLPPALPFLHELSLQDIRYTYPSSQQTEVLSGVNFIISPGQSIGITGPSGSGKTTFLHILLGFIDNYTGQYKLDNTQITAQNHRALHQLIGYVDQNIFILDASIAQNVAFGITPDQIDLEKVERALRQAQLWDFVCSLPSKLENTVGENGKLLSGGQRQRLGLARAFYRDIKILVLDEASSALDAETEQSIFSFLETLKGKLTIIMVAHRLSTLKACDRIDFFDGGQIVSSGSFAKLYSENEKFRRYIDYAQLNVTAAA